MTTAVREQYDPLINSTFKNIRVKMVELQKEIRKEEERAKEFKMAIKEEHLREREAVDKQRNMRDRMQQIDTLIDKIQGKIQYTKEREFVASRRYLENLKMCEFLKRNKIDIPAFEEKMSENKYKAAEVARDISELNKKIDVKKGKVDAAERRELKARNRIDHFEEMLRTSAQIEKREATNYQPKSEEEYREIIDDLTERLGFAMKKIRVQESRQRELEKREEELQAHVDKMKKKRLDVEQTRNELRGSRPF